jgi:hypothetical protein
MKIDADKVNRMVRFYKEEVLPNNMSIKDMAIRFQMSVGGVKYNLKKAGVWRPMNENK